jgi:hypothetical protein
VAIALKLLDVVALLKDLPRYRLRRGQVGTIVELYKSGRYEVEFADQEGRTLALVSLPRSALLRLSYDRGAPHSRSKQVA